MFHDSRLKKNFLIFGQSGLDYEERFELIFSQKILANFHPVKTISECNFFASFC